MCHRRSAFTLHGGRTPLSLSHGCAVDYRLSSPMKLIPPVPKWDKTVDGLASGWSSDYKRSLLPDNILVPLPGQVWETLRDCKVGFRASVSNTPLQFGDAGLRKGEKVRVVLVDDGPKPLYVEFVPLRYTELEPEIVPEEICRVGGYQGYYLSVQTAKTAADFLEPSDQAYFNEDFTLAKNAA